MGIDGLEKLIEDDGFTLPFIVDLESGTWMDAKMCVFLRLTSDQLNKFDNMSDSERIEYANKHSTVRFG